MRPTENCPPFLHTVKGVQFQVPNQNLAAAAAAVVLAAGAVINMFQ
jgi:hypothetical protein